MQACRYPDIYRKGQHISPSALRKYILTKDQLLLDLDYVLKHTGAEFREILNVLSRTVKVFSKHLDHLYQELPLTLNHNDYHAKNLLHVDGRIIPVDWESARISPHIGDLYCLIEEAKDQHISKAEIVGTYNSALKDLGVQEEVTDWHLDMGGICWSIHCLQWILEFGLVAIPMSKGWVPNFLTYLCAALPGLEKT